MRSLRPAWRGFVRATPELNGAILGGIAIESIDFSSPSGDYGDLAVQRVVVVNKGTHTISVDAAGPGGSQLVYVFERSLSVVWVPFNGTASFRESCRVRETRQFEA